MISTAKSKINYGVYNMQNLGAETTTRTESRLASADKAMFDSDNMLLLQRAANYWNNLREFRQRRERNRRYYRGDQWGDKVFDPDTETFVAEEELIKRHGKVPLKQNQIRQLIKNLIGQFLMDATKTAVVAHKRSDQAVAEMLTNTIQYGLQINRARDIDTRNIEEFFLSGAAAWRSSYQFIDKFQREDVWTENSPMTNMFFTPNIRDIRMTDMDFIGRFQDLYVDKIVAAFARTPEDEEHLRMIYSFVQNPLTALASAGQSLKSFFADNQEFYMSPEPDKGRVFEIWEQRCEWRLRCHDWLSAKPFVAELKDKAIIDRENMTRLNDAAMQGIDPKMVPLITYEQRYQQFWKVKYLAWQGQLLFEQETPYDHKEHPFTLLLYPLIDGEVWGFVEDIIDQQRYVNRLVTLLDFIIGSSAKGVLLVPEDSIAADFDMNRIAEEWTKFNGVIKIKLKPGAELPTQISANSTNVGIHELLSLQLRFMSEISGVSGSIQGQDSASGTPASLYAQQTQNSTINSRDYFEAFNSARTERDWKMLKTQIQYYEDDRTLALSGATYSDESLVFKKTRAQDVEFDMVLAKSPDSPVYRGIIEASLEKFVLGGFIDFESYLKNSSLPFSDNLLNDIQMKKKQMMETGGIPPMVDGKVLGEVGSYLTGKGADASKANPKTMAMADKFMSGLNNIV